jgi:dipeptidyl aminopeptidase/acylaminoacyl peptidase
MRRPLARAILALTVVLAGLPATVAETVAAARPTIQQFLRIRTPGAPVVLPDGSLLYRDWPDGVFQLYRAVPKNAADPNYAPGEVTVTKLTDYPDGLSGFSLSPDGRRVVLMHARGGNENTQLTLLDPMAGPGAATSPIVANPKVQASVNLWHRDGSAVVYSANEESPEDFYLYRWDFATSKATRLLGEKGSWAASDVTRDGKRMLVMHFISASNTEVFELDLETGKRTELTIRPKDGTAACEAIGYLPNEKAVLLASDWKDGRSRLFQRDLRSGAVREVLPALSGWELDGAIIDDDREYLIAVVNENGYSAPHLYTLPDFKPLPPPTTEKGVLGGSSFRNGTLIWTLSNARRPSTAFMSKLSRSAKRAEDHATRQLTWTDDQGIDFNGFSLPELVTYKAFDGRDISAFVFLPPGHQKGTPIPFIVIYHGGPESQHRPGFSAADQYLLTRGFGLLKPNVRGSTGYGREFQMLDDYKKRWDSVRDGVDAAEWLVKSGYSQPGRIATFGGSYGGFMSVACIVEDQERVERGERKERLFGSSVNIVGIANLRTFLERTSGYRRALREVEYGPLTDTEFLESVSSLNRVEKIQVPMFIAHGFNDPRVPVEEAMQLAAALKERGRNPRVFIAPDEGHGFAKLDNRIYFNERAAAFLEETIGRTLPQASTER